MQPFLLAADFGAPLPIIMAMTVLVVGLLFVRFVIRKVITLVKIAILVAIAVATYLGLAYLFN